MNKTSVHKHSSFFANANTSTHNTSQFGVLAIVVASFLWGTTGTAAQFAPSISPLAIGAFAMGTAGLLLCIFAYKQILLDLHLLKRNPVVFLLGALCVAVYPLAYYSSMRLSGVAIGTVVSIASAPLFAAVLEFVIGKKPVSKIWVISFCFGATGVVFLFMGKSELLNAIPSLPLPNGASPNLAEADIAFSSKTSYTNGRAWGIVLGLIAGLTYAGYSFAAKHLINGGVNSKSAMASLFGAASLLLLPSLFFTGGELFASATNTTVSVYMAIIPMFLGYVLFGYGLKTVEASRATLITLIEPLVATLFAILLIGETFKLIGWLGMFLVCICLCIQTLKLPLVSASRPEREGKEVKG